MALLLKVFQSKFVDVTTIGSIVRTKIAQIRMFFIVKPTDLNATTYNEDIGYDIILDYGPLGAYLRKCSSKIHKKMYHSFKMDHSRLGEDLEEALKFQRTFAEIVYVGLNARFVDNYFISCFKILNPTNMPSRQIGLQN